MEEEEAVRKHSKDLIRQGRKEMDKIVYRYKHQKLIVGIWCTVITGIILGLFGLLGFGLCAIFN